MSSCPHVPNEGKPSRCRGGKARANSLRLSRDVNAYGALANPQDGALWAPQLVDYTDISGYDTQVVMDHLPHA